MANQALNSVTMVPGGAAIARLRFIEVSGGAVQQVGTAGGNAVGISAVESELNSATAIPVVIFNGGIADVEAGAAVSAGVDVASDNQGRAIPATAGSRILGTAVTSSTAAGTIIEVVASKAGRMA